MNILKNIAWAPFHIKISFVLMAIFILTIIFADWIMPYPPNKTNLANVNQPPVFMNGSWAHPLGTDQIGRDMVSRTIYGLRVSAGIALTGLFIGCALGVAMGLIAGYFGGMPDKIITTLIDLQQALPNQLLMLMGIVLFGTNIIVFVVLIGFARWERYARLVRGQVFSLKKNQYIEAARVSGGSNFYIITKHILPNVMPTIVVTMTLYFPGIINLESSLSYLGIGIQPPTATLGRMIGDGRDYLFSSWWISLIPAVVILILTLVVQTIGDWARETLSDSNLNE